MIISIGHIANAGNSVSFEGQECKIQNRKGTVIGKIPASTNGLYKVEHKFAAAATTEHMDILTLHKQPGHISADAIWALVLNNVVTRLQLLNPNSSFTCDLCEYAKATRKPINKERTTKPAQTFGEEIHSDLWGPSPISTIGGYKYYVSFTDDYSRYTNLDLLKYKDEALTAYKAFAAWAENQHGVCVKRFCSDRGSEYTGHKFKRFLQEQGTEQRLMMHDTPQHNGVAEALNRRLFEWVCAILHHLKLPKSLWGEAVLFAVWLKNRTSTRMLGNITPFEKLYGSKPNLAGVPKWGQRIWVYNEQGSKLDACAVECCWVGYNWDSTHTYRVYWPNKHRVSIERNIKFVLTMVTIHSLSLKVSPSVVPTAAPPQAEKKNLRLMLGHYLCRQTHHLRWPLLPNHSDLMPPAVVRRRCLSKTNPRNQTCRSQYSNQQLQVNLKRKPRCHLRKQNPLPNLSNDCNALWNKPNKLVKVLWIKRLCQEDFSVEHIPRYEGALYAEIKDEFDKEKMEALQISEQDLVTMAIQDP
jgi:Integrase core domain